MCTCTYIYLCQPFPICNSTVTLHPPHTPTAHTHHVRTHPPHTRTQDQVTTAKEPLAAAAEKEAEAQTAQARAAESLSGPLQEMETQEAVLDELCTKVEDAGKLLEKGKAGEAASASEGEVLVEARGRVKAAGTELDTSLEEATATCAAGETEEEEERAAWVEESGGKEEEEVKHAMEVFEEEKVRAPCTEGSERWWAGWIGG